MRQRLWMVLICAAQLIGANIPVVAAQDAEPTTEPIYDPTCAVDLMKAYMSAWEYDHRSSEGQLDVIVAAEVARNVHKAFAAIKADCKDTIGDFKKNLLRSMHGDYPPEDLARMLSYIQEAVGSVEFNDCSYSVALQYIRQVDWGDMPAVQVGKTMGEIFRTVRDVIPSGECDGTFQIIQEIISQIEDVPADGTLISTLYKLVGDATQGHYISEYSCDYTLAKNFFEKVQWDNMTSADIVKLVSDTLKITYKIGGDSDCDSDPALAITAMLLNDSYHFKPDASIIQLAYDAATGELVVTPEATAPPIVN